MTERENFNSRLGFLLVSAGCAIGIGNVWRFPYVAGQGGGGIFVLFYLLFLVCMGIPVLTMELAVGRGARLSVTGAFHKLEPAGSHWHWHGWICLLGSTLLMLYYTTVSGWMLGYFFRFVSGSMDGMPHSEVPKLFESLLASPLELTEWMLLTVVAGFAVLWFGVKNGLERVTKFMMASLLVLIVVLALHSMTLPGAAEGLKFFLLPDLGRAMQSGLGQVASSAMFQAFFTLSIGIGSMQIFGSYMPDDRRIAGEAVRITVLDTIVAVAAGLIIFPACFAYSVAPNAGPALIFITLPNVFLEMPAGQLWGSLFFLFMTFASFSTVTAVCENIVAMTMDAFGWSRTKAVVIGFLVVAIGSMPCVLGFNVLSNLTVFGKGVLDCEDFVVSSLLLPGGSLVFIFFCLTRYGWGWDKFIAETNRGTGLALPAARWLRLYLTFVLPLLVLFVFVQGL